MNMDTNVIKGLLFYFQNSAELDPGIQGQTVAVLNSVLEQIEKEEAAKKKKRKSPNKSGILQIDPENGKIVAEYASQKEALEAIGKEGKSGIGDAVNRRNKTRRAYGYIWVFKNEYDEFLQDRKKK